MWGETTREWGERPGLIIEAKCQGVKRLGGKRLGGETLVAKRLVTYSHVRFWGGLVF